MISKFFGWLGAQIAKFFIWLGNFLWDAFLAVLDVLDNVLDYIYEQIMHFGGIILEAVLKLVPNDPLNGQNFAQTISYMRSAWNTFDDFVPLSEGLTFVTVFFAFYLGVKVVAIAVRIILALIP